MASTAASRPYRFASEPNWRSIASNTPAGRNSSSHSITRSGMVRTPAVDRNTSMPTPSARDAETPPTSAVEALLPPTWPGATGRYDAKTGIACILRTTRASSKNPHDRRAWRGHWMMPAPARSPDWWSATAIGVAASLVALALQQGVRMAWQVRSLPERVMEWLLVFVPLDLFERGLQQFGANAKDVALAGTLVGMAILLIVVGALTVRTVSSGWLALLVGLGLWLFAMVIVMPAPGAGLFATGLLVSPALTDASYLFVFGGYAAVLALGTDVVRQLDRVRPGP